MAGAPFSQLRHDRRETKWTLIVLIQIVLYVGGCVAILTLLPSRVWLRDGGVLLGIVGAFGVWRYSLWATHLVRAALYGRRTYPRLAAGAAAAWAAGWRPRRLHILITTFHERPETTNAVVAAICAEIRAVGRPATLWLGSKDAADEVVFGDAVCRSGRDLDIHLRIVRQTGSGKRNAIALILAAMARDGLGRDDLVAFMDSDFLITPGAFQACTPLFAIDPELHAVTTDEDCVIDGPWWVRTWLDMRFAQRRLAIQSHALSGRVLTLTGRFSIFRATHITSPEFIGLVANDTLDHWLWGEFRILSGDDKSTWYALLRRGERMLYVPDAHGVTLEVIEGSAVRRMAEKQRRWSGNMLRNGSRAIALGPRRMPLFIWWCLIDQRIAMWTMLLGPACALAGCGSSGRRSWSPGVYVALTRLVVALVLAAYSSRVDLNVTWLLYVNQLANAAIKLYMIWRLPKQRWFNRGNQSAGARGGRIVGAAREAMAAYLTGFSVLALVGLALVATSALAIPSRSLMAALYAGLAHAVR